jgi:subfamily B ATP-binding cassette protein MsbA
MAEPQKEKGSLVGQPGGDARELIWTHRRRLLLGAVLMLIQSGDGPGAARLDQVPDRSGNRQRTHDLLWKIAVAAGAATIIQALTSFSLSQVLGVAAQRAITEMRKKVQAKIARLPVSYFDSTPGRQTHFAHHERRRGHS